MPLSDLESTIFDQIQLLVSQDKLVLPTLPEVALKAREVAASPDVTAAQLAKVVKNDTALTVRLIKVANSPLMRGQREIEDLQQAIARMGISFAANLITGLAMKQMFQATSEHIDRLMRQVWTNATTVAGIAGVLCRHYTKLKPDQATLAGLVHEVGVLPILSFAEGRPDLLRDGITLSQVIDALHPTLGELILTRWNFPAELIAVPKGYRDFTRQAAAADYVDLVMVASLEAQLDSDQEATVDWHTVTAFNRLGINPEPDSGDQDIPLLTEKSEMAALLSP